MVRGRKKQPNSYNQVLTMRITTEQQNLIKKNKWIKEEITKQVRDYIDVYLKK